MKRENKILLIFLSPPCEVSNGNLITDSSWYKFIVNFGSQGDNLRIISPLLKDKDKDKAFKIQQNRLKINKIKHFYYDSFKSYYKNLFLNPFKNIGVYFKEIKNSNLIIYRIPNPGFTLVSLIALIYKKPLIVFISGNIIEQSDAYLKSKGIFRAFLRFVLIIRNRLHRLALFYSSYIFPVSSELLNFYKINKKTNYKLIRTPIISIRDIRTDIEKIKVYNRKNPLRIIRVCWLQESKGIENLINVVKNLKKNYPIEIDIYGEAKEESYKVKLMDLIEKYDLSNQIRLKGWVSNNELKNIYNNYDLHLVTSLSEGMPRVCLEASSRGLPQILTPVGGVNDFYTHLHDAYICEDSSIDSIEKGIIWFINNPHNVRNIIMNSTQSTKESSIEEVSALFNKIVDKLL